MNTFQTVILLVFGFLAMIGVGIFALSASKGRNSDLGMVRMWGTVSEESMQGAIAALNNAHTQEFHLDYAQFQPEDFEQKLIEAIASGSAPDMVLLPDELLYRHKDKLALFPEEIISPRTFKDTFAERGEIFLSGEGVYALPFGIDPLVMYWNRDMITAVGLSRIPKTWEEVVGNTAILTKRDPRGGLQESAISLGGIGNMPNMKAILSALFLQVDEKIAQWGDSGKLNVSLGETKPQGEPSLSALRFYSEFTNPQKSVYTWNTALPSARELFLRGGLAMYIGFASELPILRLGNPNLNLDAGLLPTREGKSPLTFGRVYGVAILKSAPSQSAAAKASVALMDKAIANEFTLGTGIPSGQRAYLSGSTKSKDPTIATFEKAALLSRGWVDPNPLRSNKIFADMVMRVTTGELPPDQALSEAARALSAIVKEE